jgi:hypothetical protein
VLPGGTIDASLKSTATEFRGRLVQYGGSLQSMVLNGGTVSAAWTSSKCDYFEAEVIDLLLSVNRTQKSSPSIRGTRACLSKNRTFSIDAATFQRYRTGKIGDSEVLKGIK